MATCFFLYFGATLLVDRNWGLAPCGQDEHVLVIKSAKDPETRRERTHDRGQCTISRRGRMSGSTRSWPTGRWA